MLELELACCLGHLDAFALGRAKRRRAQQRAVLFRCFAGTAGVVVRVTQAPQFGRRETRFSPHLGEPGARDLGILRQWVAQQQLLEGPLRPGCLAELQLHLPKDELKAGAGCGRTANLRQHPLSSRGIVHRQKHCRLELRRLGVEDAVGIAARETAQQSLRGRLIACFMTRLGAQEIRVVGQFFSGLARLAQALLRFAVALVCQIGVA